MMEQRDGVGGGLRGGGGGRGGGGEKRRKGVQRVCERGVEG